MTLGKYLMSRINVLVLNGLGIFVLNLYLLALGNTGITVLLIAIIWSVILGIVIYVGYRGRKSYFDQVFELLEQLEKPYLIQEFMGNSWNVEDQLYKDILYTSNKAVIEQIYQLEESQKEYREFIESWIHEVKLPITGMRLASHNMGEKATHRMETYLTQMDHAVEQALFYARSDQVYKDYQMSETNIREIAIQMVRRNKYLLIQNQMSVEVKCEDVVVITDKKWLEFILVQILLNAVKYKKPEGGTIVIQSEKAENEIRITMQDNGIGIPDEEVGRIFEKGFTGSNGRKREKSTGFGLYLCYKLCLKLGMQIEAESMLNEYTKIRIRIPIRTEQSYLSKL